MRPLFEIALALDVRDVLPTIAVPTLAMWRPRDSAQSGDLLRASAELIPDARRVELPGTDHWWSAEPQEPMLEALGDFIGGAGRRVARVARVGEEAGDRALHRHR